jgi:hypothetical protein
VDGIHYRDLVKILHARKSYSVDGGNKSERERERERERGRIRESKLH